MVYSVLALETEKYSIGLSGKNISVITVFPLL
jgi:hypothetical protein